MPATRHPARRADGARLAALLRAGELDAAIGAGLMEFDDDPALDPAARALVVQARDRLRQAWAARERHRARAARLARRAAEREARRNRTGAASDGLAPALPAAAAAALARAHARAGGKA